MKDLTDKIMLTICFLTVGLCMQAQIGVTGGVNLSTLRNGNTNLRWDNSLGVGFQLGAFYDIILSDKFKLQPSLVLLKETYRRSMPSEPDKTGVFKQSFDSYSCLATLVFSYKLPVESGRSFLVDLGIYGSLGLWGKIDVDNDPVRKKIDLYPDNLALFDFGLITGAGYEAGRISYSFRFKHGYLLNGSTRGKPMSFLFSVGYRLR